MDKNNSCHVRSPSRDSHHTFPSGQGVTLCEYEDISHHGTNACSKGFSLSPFHQTAPASFPETEGIRQKRLPLWMHLAVE